MPTARPVRFLTLVSMASCFAPLCADGIHAQETPDMEPVVRVHEGPGAAFDFEKSFRDATRYGNSQPIRLDQCENITELTMDLWSKKHVLTDFKQRRTTEQVGVIVIVKTEYCCGGSRLCAATTACLEKKSTPLVGRFRVYAGWIKNHPDHSGRAWAEWDRDVIEEYRFIQGPGARVIVMVPTWDGKMYEWHSTATELDLSVADLQRHQGETPKLESFLNEALQYAPLTIPSDELP